MEMSNGKSARKSWFTPHFDFTTIPIKKPKIESSKPTPNDNPTPQKIPRNITSQNKSVTNDDLRWMDKFDPKTVTDLAVNAKKVQEVQTWIQQSLARQRGAPILLLTGPTGAGKTATLRVLCKTHRLEIREWVTPLDTEYAVENDYTNQNYTIKPRQTDLFSEFLLQARYPSLLGQLSGENRQLILVEDYPNAFVKDPTVFHSMLQSYYEKSTTPIVFICTDSKDRGLNLSRNLFPQNIQDLYHIVSISFNSVSSTLMKTALKNICTMMMKNWSNLYKTLPQDSIDSVMNSSMGDIRNAVINLHFAALKGSIAIPTCTSELKSTKRPKNKGGKLANIGSDESLNLMHGIGRVLYPKRTTTGTNWRFVHDPDSIVDHFLSQPANFVAFLHENYPTHYANIHDLSRAVEHLSAADEMLQQWKEKDVSGLYALTIAVRGLMVSNQAPVSSWSSVRGPKTIKADLNNLKRHPLLPEFVVRAEEVTDYLPYCKIIQNN